MPVHSEVALPGGHICTAHIFAICSTGIAKLLARVEPSKLRFEVEKTDIVPLLERSFPPEGWAYLRRNLVFQLLWGRFHQNDEDIAFLVEAGEILLRQKKEMNLE